MLGRIGKIHRLVAKETDPHDRSQDCKGCWFQDKSPCPHDKGKALCVTATKEYSFVLEEVEGGIVPMKPK